MYICKGRDMIYVLYIYTCIYIYIYIYIHIMKYIEQTVCMFIPVMRLLRFLAGAVLFS